jgi:hypothetical protein
MYKFSPHIRRTTVDRDGSIILDVREGVISRINPVGAVIWELLEQGMEDTAIIDALCTRFPEQPRDGIAADVVAFVAELTRKDILQSCSSDADSGVVL